MSVDALFWDIVGLANNGTLPLSFRAHGAWVLRPPTIDLAVSREIEEVDALAAHVLAEIEAIGTADVSSASVPAMLQNLGDLPSTRGAHRALAICLLIECGRLDEAMQLCRADDDALHPLMRESGGFTTQLADGQTVTFLDQARDWIAGQDRKTVRPA